jgi:anti-sigma regulatory factor (Ser/Thr protein kinase)
VQDDVLEQREVGEMRIRLAADAASVPGARRFVTDGLTSLGRTELLDDAALCVTELAANAALHSASTFMEVCLRPLDRAVQIVVEDDGPEPADVVVPRASFDERSDVDDDELDLDELDLDEIDLALADESTTGRGLGIVSVLAQDWGVEGTGAGKRVWLTLVKGDGTHAVRPPSVSTTSARRDADAALPEGWAIVRLAGCPVQLSLRQDSHLDELVRELQLLDGEQAAPESRALAQKLEALLGSPAHARLTGRRIAQQAAAEGQTHVDIDMTMPRELGPHVRALQEAVWEADRLCEERRLLTLASDEDLRELRAWMTEQVSGQLGRGKEPVAWEVWRAGRSD